MKKEKGKVGLFELAHEGTLFLDEIGDLPLSLQAKLLKYLDDHEIMRLGGVKPRKVVCKIIAATNRNLHALKEQGTFRDDLFYRLDTFTIRIPPLRERPDDVFEFVQIFLSNLNKKYKQKKKISIEVIEDIQKYPFYGNVRESICWRKNDWPLRNRSDPTFTWIRWPSSRGLTGHFPWNTQSLKELIQRDLQRLHHIMI